MMRRSDKIHFLLVLAVISTAVRAGAARGGTIWEFTHRVRGEGTANVFDGGPVVSDSVDTTLFREASFFALDLTTPGTQGASFSTAGSSEVRLFEDGTIGLELRFSSLYDPSLFGGDRPGGVGEGFLSVVFEVVMPADQVQMGFSNSVNVSGGFAGSTNIVVENLTKSTTLLEITSRAGGSMVLDDVLGDLIRITADISGGIDFPPGAIVTGGYSLRGLVGFGVIPEPSTFLLVLFGVVFVMSRNRPIHHEPERSASVESA